VSTEYVGEVSIASFLPGVTPVLTAAQAQLTVQLTGTGAQLAGALAAVAQLEAQVTEPSVYVGALITGNAQASVNLAGAIPAVLLGLQITAALGIVTGLQLSVGNINVSIDLIVALLGVMAAGGYAFSHNSALAALGGELNAVTPDTGLDPGSQVQGVTFLVSSGNAESVAALNTVFRVS
jgi:hypothetical protein